MAFAETAKLAVDLSLKGNLSSGLKNVEGQLGRLETRFGKVGQGVGTLGRGLGTAVRNGALLAGVAVGGLTALLAQSVKEGQDSAKVQTIYANAIANSGKVSSQYVTVLNKQQEALMNLAGINDEEIKTEQTRLIQMGLTGDQVAKLTPLILDMSKATGRDLLTSTIAVGKATNGNVAGLQRFGIMIDKAKAKVDPFGAVVDALNKKFGGTTQALSGSLESRLGAFRANLENIREEAGIKLLPALTRIVDVAGTQLVPAFGKFVDRILPSVVDGVNSLADALSNGGAERGIKNITDALGPMVDTLKIAAEPVKMIVKAFLSLPSQVQGILVGAFAINKLSGGLFAQGIGQIGKGLLGGVLGGLAQRGGTPANPVFVSDVTGGLGGAAGIAGGIGLGTAAVAVAAAAVPIALALGATSGQKNAPGSLVPNLYNRYAPSSTFSRVSGGNIGDYGAPHPGSTNAGVLRRMTTALPSAAEQRLNLAEMGVLRRALAAGKNPTQDQVTRTYQRTAARAAEAQAAAAKRAADASRATTAAIKDGDAGIIAAIRGMRPPTVNVSVTASDIQKVQVQRRAAVKAHGSRNSRIGGPTQFD